ncbi:c-type cytochrome [Geminocystis sp. GBBB08]|uniref:c-type cytochrome n=1 Tax=Geminocystis sp. GBBB08 TaxID=2604140 RepID=UPI0027E31FC5|nr:c-type cytochrome [Geminocystis sp. GBBB08]MBL1208479.1 c-type cytochrome [Geminocystis sp. GBBB08]
MQKTLLFFLSLSFFFLLNLYLISPIQAQTLNNLTGKEIFSINCAGCHPNGSNIIRRGKNLRLKTLQKNGYNSVEAIANIITNGKNNMSSFKDRLTEKEINQVAKYVIEQAENNWQ